MLQEEGVEQQRLYPIFYKRRHPDANQSSVDIPKRSKPHRERHNKEQLYLDLGQRSIGHVECSACGMVYTHSQSDDLKDHFKFHNSLDIHHPRISFMGWKNERVLKSFSDGRIIMVLPSDHKQHLKKVNEILSVVDQDLGFISDKTDNDYIHVRTKSFLFVSKEVIGYAMAEEVTEAYEMQDSITGEENDSESGSWYCNSEIPRSCQLGINRIWVHSHHRRKGIATKLLDAIRENFYYGYTVPKNMLAFSDPTDKGRRLARNYCNGVVLIYKWRISS